ncbi:MAG: histidine kinase, partial [Bacteroidales bacterium]|nr:histidine kinase [Bacteroidales bacterium]
LVRDRFIDFIGQNPHSFNVPNATPVGLVHTGGRNRDFIFGINSGYSKQPRNIYRYMIDADSLLKSPESGASLGDIRLADLDQDSIPEIVLTTRATGNFDENMPYTDQVTWLMAMDLNLRFIFPPVVCGSYPGNAELEIVHENNQPLFVVWYNYSGAGADSTALLVFDATGKKLKQRDLNTGEHSDGRILRNTEESSDVFFLLNTRTGLIDAYNSSLRQTVQYHLPGKLKLLEQSLMDLDNDGSEELVLTNYPERLIVIRANDFRHYGIYKYPEGQDMPIPSMMYRGTRSPHLYLQFKEFGQILSFERNPWYWLRLVWPPGLYLGISFFLLGMFRIQRYRANLAHAREKRIVALQMKALRNQIEPHFTFNIINAMGGLYLSGTDKEEAYDIYVNYANFLRQMIMSSDQVSMTLKDELEFVQNFINIEKARCDNSFEYFTEVDPSVDLQTNIPRTLIFTFVENAVKYGIRCRKDKNGYIRVTIMPEKKQIKMIIENSGPGINHPRDKSQGTGRGLAILREMADLYERLEGKKISFRLEDIADDDGKVKGTRGVVEFG